jgi:hypothetical protein
MRGMNAACETVARQALLDAIMQRAADQLGDITPQVYARFDARFPEGRATFDTLHPGGRATLQGSMVEQSLYCLMEWLGSPGEIEIVLLGTVPHHADTLNVPPELFTGLLDAVAATVADTIPPENVDERALWNAIRADLTGVIGEAAQFTRAALSGCPHAVATGFP